MMFYFNQITKQCSCLWMQIVYLQGLSQTFKATNLEKEKRQNTDFFQARVGNFMQLILTRIYAVLRRATVPNFVINKYINESVLLSMDWKVGISIKQHCLTVMSLFPFTFQLIGHFVGVVSSSQNNQPGVAWSDSCAGRGHDWLRMGKHVVAARLKKETVVRRSIINLQQFY